MAILAVGDSGEYGPSLVFECGDLPADEAVLAAGHEPNGYFWEGVATFLEPDAVEALDLDCEGGMFAAYGDAALLERVRAALEPLVSDGAAATALIARAEAEGFEFDD